MKSNCLFITDHYLSSVNGISLFSRFFTDNYLKEKHDGVIIFESLTKKIHYENIYESSISVSVVYINAHFSNSDSLFRKIIEDLNLQFPRVSFLPNFTRIMISHGWIKIAFRNHYYYYYYSIKNYFRSNNIERISFYDKMLFISKESDNFRHLDYKYALKKRMNIEFFDFKKGYVKLLRENQLPIQKYKNDNSYILVIANLEFVKNVFSIFYSNYLKKLRKEIGVQKIIILTPRMTNLQYKLLLKLCKYYSFEIVNDNLRKQELLKNSSCLYIPSITEYLPLVSLEALANGKKVYSLFKITALVNNNDYKFLVNSCK
jgi:hypothetical protein